MSMSYVRALYDFTGEPNTSELSIVADEILTVTRTDVGEGWWEGRNSKGQIGLFPAAYVNVLSAVEVQQQNNGGNNVNQNNATSNNSGVQQSSRYDQTADEWNDGQDEWDDDWDDDNDTYSEIGPSTTQQNNNFSKQGNFMQAQSQQQANYANMNLPPTPSDDTISIASTMNTTNSAVKRPGIFSRSSDSYISGSVNIPVPENEKVNIIQADNCYYWQPISQPYTVTVASPKKETKFKGMKSFIAYQLTPSFNNISVSRRYKHFDWLHLRLQEKFCLIPIPPLPDKQISGRYEKQFVEHRRIQLQEFVDWVCRHPVLSQCQVWMHFLTCTDEKKWKTGKRLAEKDPLVGMNYCLAIFPPEKQLLTSYVDAQLDSFLKFVTSMDIAVKELFTIATDQYKTKQVQARKDFQRIGDGLAGLACALELDERRFQTAESLSKSIGRVSGLYITIGHLFDDQPKHDWIPFSDSLHIYRGILDTFPDILASQKNAIQKRKEYERQTGEQKMNNAQLAEIHRRVDVIAYAILAEISHFRSERDQHLKMTMKQFIDEQIQFYMNVIDKLKEAQHHFS